MARPCKVEYCGIPDAGIELFICPFCGEVLLIFSEEKEVLLEVECPVCLAYTKVEAA